MNRRYHPTLLTLFVCMLAAALVFSACGGDDEGAAAPDGDGGVTQPDTGAVSPTAEPGATTTDPAPVEATGDPVAKRLIISTAAPTTESSNPWRYESPRGPWFFAATHESLIGADADTGEHVPQLAESWTIEPDGRSVRWKLRENIRFHGDNGVFTSADLVAMLENATADDSTHSHRTQYRAVTPDVISDYEIVYRIERTNPEILNNTSSWNVISGEPYSSKDMASLGGNPDLTMRPPAGTGAYQFVERAQGVNFIVERVPYEHWRYQPDWEEIEFRFSNEASTRLASLLTDEIHVTVLPLDLQQQAEEAGMGVATGQVLTRERSGMFQGPILDKNYADYEAQGTPCGYANCDDALLDVRVRKALAKAVDRGAMNEAFFGGRGVEVHNPHFVPTRSYWNPEWDARFDEEYGYNPEAAMALLAEAGYGPNNPLQLQVDVTGSSGLPEKQDVMEAMAGYFNDIGIKTELDVRDPTITRAASRRFDFGNRIIYMTSNIVDLQAFRVHHCSCESPRSGFELKELDETIAYHRSVIETEEVFRRLRETGDITFDLHIAIPIVWRPEQLLYNPNVVASYEWSGVPLGTVSHFERFIAVRK
ncbi:MAG: ABC transporter substrate-binding protein [Chloroflexi bacterium]|nr:ABC transporter substrate-binding protein [Chloroflexota bacterium]